MHPIADGLLHKEACFLSLSHPQISKFKNCSCIGVLSLYFNSHPFLSYSKFIRIYTFPLIIQHSHGHSPCLVGKSFLTRWAMASSSHTLTFMKPEGIPTQRFRQLGFCCTLHPLFDGPIYLAKQEMLQPRPIGAGKVIFQTAPEGPLWFKWKTENAPQEYCDKLKQLLMCYTFQELIWGSTCIKDLENHKSLCYIPTVNWWYPGPI